MHTRDIRRGVSAAAVAVSLGVLTLAPGVASASGGGGCGQPVTDAVGAGVDIRDYCFSPTILRVSTGGEVTFTNVDPVPHSVLGANATWGDYAGFKKKAVTYRFPEPGVYPYLCTYHVGMVGVVVVGDGIGGATDTTTTDGPVTKVDASDLALENTAAVAGGTVPEASGAWPIVAGAAFGIVVGALATIVVRRRRGPSAGGAGPGR
ncbi:MAG: plastocyanin/azurin family copper-binding protein [Actinomycetota bacterium]